MNLFTKKNDESGEAEDSVKPDESAQTAASADNDVPNPTTSTTAPASGADNGGQRMSTDTKNQQRAATSAAVQASQIEADVVGGASLDRLDRIRDILFGREMRDYEKKLAELERRVQKNADDLREHLEARLESLEEYSKKEFESAVAKLKAEQKKREESIDEVSDRIKQTGNTLERKVADLDEKISDNHRDLREQILNQSKSLNEEIRRRVSDFEKTLEHHVNDLRSDKMDRAALAALLKEMSMRINRELDNLELQ